MSMLDTLPLVNACLNGLAAVLLATGWVLIKQGRRDAHRNCMIAAFAVSAAFLACYLTYHFGRQYYYGVASKAFPGTGVWKTIYLAVLIPHIILAIVMLPMIFATFWRAYREQWDKHRRIARITLPIWLYVSVTGVIVYVMLYQISW